jgi:hypothetical protein
MVTTESATAAATVANRPAGCLGLWPVSSVTFEVVNACTVTSDLPSPSVKASGFPQPDPEQRERRAPQH